MEERVGVEIWTVEECAKFLKVSLNTMYRMVSEKREPKRIFARKIGRNWRISSREVMRFLEEKEDDGFH